MWVASREKRLVVPSLLLSIAVLQLISATVGRLTPWKGGGFGMFATIDSPNRFIVIRAITSDGASYPVTVPTGQFAKPRGLSSRFWRITQAFPTEQRINELASAVAESNMVIRTRPPAALPTRLAVSDHARLLGGLKSDKQALEVIGPRRTSSSVENVLEIQVRILRVRFSMADKQISLEEVGFGSARAMTAMQRIER